MCMECAFNVPKGGTATARNTGLTFGLAVYASRADLAKGIVGIWNYLRRHTVGGAITALERHWGSHIAPVVIADDSADNVLDLGLMGTRGNTWDAMLGGLQRNLFADNVREFTADGSRIWVYRFAQPLTVQQKWAGLTYCKGIEGLPYDVLDFARRAVVDVAELLEIASPLVPVISPIVRIVRQIASVDISAWLGIKAVICYRVGCDFLTSMGFPGLDGATFGPHTIETMQAAGVFQEAIEATNETGGPPH